MVELAAELSTRGYLVVHGADERDRVMLELTDAGFVVTRDVKIAAQGEADLIAQQGDFWFHTDGVFLPTPPRWVLVEILAAEGGGGLHVLDGRPLTLGPSTARIWWGTDRAGLAASPVTTIGGQQCLRYRADYMLAMDDEAPIAELHDRVTELAACASVSLGALEPGSALFVDNWRMLHRREAFSGQRVIRRLWLSPTENV